MKDKICKAIQRILLTDKEAQYSGCSVSRMKIKKGEERIEKNKEEYRWGLKEEEEVYMQEL